MTIRRSCRKLVTTVFAGIAFTVISSGGQATVFQVHSLGVQYGMFNMSKDGVELQVSGGSFNNEGGVIAGTAEDRLGGRLLKVRLDRAP